MDTIDLCKIKEIYENYSALRLRIMRTTEVLDCWNMVLRHDIPNEIIEILGKIKFSYFQILKKYNIENYVNDYIYANELKSLWKLNEIKSDLYSDLSDYVRLITLEETIYGIYDIIVNGE